MLQCSSSSGFVLLYFPSETVHYTLLSHWTGVRLAAQVSLAPQTQMLVMSSSTSTLKNQSLSQRSQQIDPVCRSSFPLAFEPPPTCMHGRSGSKVPTKLTSPSRPHWHPSHYFLSSHQQAGWFGPHCLAAFAASYSHGLSQSSRMFPNRQTFWEGMGRGSSEPLIVKETFHRCVSYQQNMLNRGKQEHRK